MLLGGDLFLGHGAQDSMKRGFWVFGPSLGFKGCLSFGFRRRVVSRNPQESQAGVLRLDRFFIFQGTPDDVICTIQQLTDLYT